MQTQRIHLREVHKSFGNRVILRGVNLDVLDGELICIIGKSGTGKSVILKHLLGFLEPDSGEIYIDGERSDHVDKKTRRQIREKIGVLFQGSALFDSMSVYDNIAFGLRRRGLSSEVVSRTADEMIQRMGLQSLIEKSPSEISGGLQKRVALCRSLVMNPEIMLYDEPTTGVDTITAGSVIRMIREIRDIFKNTSVVITHDLNLVRRIADRVAMLHNGQIVFSGTAAELDHSSDPFIRQFIEGRYIGEGVS